MKQKAEARCGGKTIEGAVFLEGNRGGMLAGAFAAALFVFFMTLPFVTRPLDMDDIIFLKFAEARLQEPLVMELHDFSYFAVLNETFIDTHPPLVSSWLALVMKLGGGSGLWLHLSFIVFPLVAALSIYFLARRYSRNAIFAALIFMATPGVAVMSHSIMSDMPGLAFLLAATAFYIYGLESRNLALMVLSGLLITAGVFSSYQVLGLLPLLFIYALLKKELSLLAMLPLVLPFSSFISYVAWHVIDTGAFPSFSHVYYVERDSLAPGTILEKIVSLFCTIGGATVFPLLIFRLIVINKREIVLFVTLAVPVAVAAFYRYSVGANGLAEALLLSLLLPLGIVFLYMLLVKAWRCYREGSGDERALSGVFLLWITGVILSIVFLLPYSSVKYALFLYPPLILLFLWLVEDRIVESNQRNLLIAVLLATAALGLLISFSDYELAVSKRYFAESYGAHYGREAEATGNRLWFSSEFGDRYYMERQGFTELTEQSQLRSGDVVILPLLAGTTIPASFGDRLQYADRISVMGKTPVRVTDNRAGAGFYGSRWGPLPYSFSNESIGEYLVYRVINP